MKQLVSKIGKTILGIGLGTLSLAGGNIVLWQRREMNELKAKYWENEKIKPNSNYSIKIHYPAVNKEIEIEKEKLGLLIEKLEDLTKQKEQKEKEITNLTKIHYQNLENFKDELFKVGAGEIGDYRKCASQFLITGQFLSPLNSNSYIGDPNELKKVEEYEIEVVSKGSKLKEIIKTLIEHHPYEEPSYKVSEDLKDIVD